MLNRVPTGVKCTLSSDKRMSDADHVEFVREDDSMCLVKWLDKIRVILLATADYGEPFGECKPWSKTDKAYLTIPRPVLIKICK